MSVERSLLISLLKLAKNGTALIETVNSDARLPISTTWKLLETLQKECLVNLEKDSIKIENDNRLRLAARAISLGADLQIVGNLLCWQEFEEITALALQNNGYLVSNNVRFKNAGHRWEIDVVGCKKPLVVCIDCKHWQHAIAPSALRRIVNAQCERTIAFADSLPKPLLKLDCAKWSEAKFIPVVLSLMPSSFKFYYKTPIVSILQVQDFVNQLPTCIETVKFYERSFNSLDQNLQN